MREEVRVAGRREQAGPVRRDKDEQQASGDDEQQRRGSRARSRVRASERAGAPARPTATGIASVERAIPEREC
jgi:hypothetical protein